MDRKEHDCTRNGYSDNRKTMEKKDNSRVIVKWMLLQSNSFTFTISLFKSLFSEMGLLILRNCCFSCSLDFLKL